MKSWPALLLRAVSEAMQQQGSVSMSMAHVTTKGHVVVLGLDCCLGPHLMWESSLCAVITTD